MRKTLIHSLFLALILVIFTPAIAEAYIDTRDNWAAPQIDHLTSRGILAGYGNGYFRPQAPITREEFVVILMKVLHKEDDALALMKGEATFADTASTWGKGYIELARELNITDGVGNNRFNPKALITREEAVTMLVNTLRGVSKTSASPYFTDTSRISAWALPAVTFAQRENIASGFPDGSFRPRQNLTRAQATALIEGWLDYKGDRFQFYGTLTGLNPARRQAAIIIDGQNQTFELGSNLAVYAEGSSRPVTTLAMPAQIYFDVDDNGNICYALLVKEPRHAKVDVTVRRLPSYALKGGEEMIPLTSSSGEKVPPSSDTLSHPRYSLDITRDAMGANDFMKLTGASGRGQLIAVIDSGIDPAHPDLQATSEGYRKIVDFIDLSGEGRVALTSAYAVNGSIIFDKTQVDVRGVPNAAPAYRLGFWLASQMPPAWQSRIREKRLLVVATASRYADKYDTVYVDTDQDGQIKDEVPLHLYRENYQVGEIKDGNASFSFAAADIAKSGEYVTLGYDSLGHGTEVAGIAAARGTITGVAPDAQLLAIKVVNGLGLTSLTSMENGIRKAAECGSRIAVISLGQYRLTEDEAEVLASLARDVWENHGMMICMAAGNDGPGLSTVTQTSSVRNVLSVGAYATPEMWQNDYNLQVKEPTLWYFSSVGPGVDGSTTPLLIAPGSAVTTAPLWTGSPYTLDEGSSMAAPHVAGAAALLMDAQSHTLYRDNAKAAWAALLSGAVPLEGYSPVEQGYGAVNLMNAWEEIKRGKKAPLSFTVTQYSPSYGMGSGMYSRSLSPGKLTVQVQNNSSSSAHLAVGGLAPWLKTGQMSMQVPAGQTRRIDVYYDIPDTPGLYNSFLALDDPDTMGTDAYAMQTVVVPVKIAESGTFQDAGALYPGRYQRYFFELPAGTKSLALDLTAIKNKGRVKLFLISPDGDVTATAYAGAGEESDTVSCTLIAPTPGVWEVVVYSSLTLSSYSLDYSAYILTAALAAAPAVEEKPVGRYLVTALPRQNPEGSPTNVTVHFFNPYTKIPASGVVSINGRLYELSAGQAEIENLYPLKLELAW